jgi:hypothetical protein
MGFPVSNRIVSVLLGVAFRTGMVGALLPLSISCTVPTGVVSGSPTAPGVVVTPIPSAIAPPSPAIRDLKLVASGDVRGDHALVMQVNAPSVAGTPSRSVWDVPLDGSPPRELLRYARSAGAFTDFDVFAFSRQLSPDGRYLVLSDVAEVAGSGLLVVDLVAGQARIISLDRIANQPAWSPDGRSIAYRAATVAGALQKDDGLWIVSAVGGQARQLVPSGLGPGPGAISVFGWSEDGGRVIYGPVIGTLNAADATTGSTARIGGATNGTAPFAIRTKRPSVAIVFNDDAAQPTPTGPRGAPSVGTQVGWVEVRDTAVASGRVVARYGPGEGTFMVQPRWRPGGDELLLFYAVGAGVRERDELVIVDALAGTRRAIPTPHDVRSADWTADGKRILYANLLEVRVVDVDGSGDRMLFRPLKAASPNEDAVVVALTAFAPR